MKSKKQIQELRAKDTNGLEKLLLDERAHITKILLGEGVSKDTSELRKRRRLVAQILTVIKEKAK